MPDPLECPNNTFPAVVPQGVHGGQANVAEKDDRWQWVSAANVGIWDTFKAWQAVHPNINLADVTITIDTAVSIKNPDFDAIKRLGHWQP